MIGADVFIKSLIEEGVDTIFGYPGGVTIPLHDRLTDYPEIKHILPRHEQGAAFAADGYYRVTGKAGVCLTTSGPGATNLITGIANAYMDSIGMVAITCQVATNMLGSDAFQEVDITGITQPITKHNYVVNDVKDLPRIVREAFHLATTGRPGPVHIDLPVDVLKTEWEGDFDYPPEMDLPGYKVPGKADKKHVEEALKLINRAAKPIVMAGHGIIISKAEKEFKQFIEKANTPVISTLLGLGALPDTHPQHFGMLGMHGMAYANYAVHNADLIIGIGLRFDDRITGKIDDFAKDAHVIHLDIDPAEIGKNTVVDVPLLGDCKQVLEQINEGLEKQDHSEWLSQISNWCDKTDMCKIQKGSRTNKESKKLMAGDFIREIDRVTDSDATVVTDVGQNQMWTAQFYNYTRPNQLLSSGGLGSMGYSLPAAVGAQFGDPDAEVWSLMGDGGIQMNIQEFGTIMEHQLPLKMVMFNNGYLGMVRQWQFLFYDKNYSATKLTNPDFVKIAKSYGIEAHRVKTFKQAKKLIAKAHKSKKPMFLEVIIDPEDNVLPMVSPGTSLSETVTEI